MLARTAEQLPKFGCLHARFEIAGIMAGTINHIFAYIVPYSRLASLTSPVKSIVYFPSACSSFCDSGLGSAGGGRIKICASGEIGLACAESGKDPLSERRAATSSYHSSTFPQRQAYLTLPPPEPTSIYLVHCHLLPLSRIARRSQSGAIGEVERRDTTRL